MCIIRYLNCGIQCIGCCRNTSWMPLCARQNVQVTLVTPWQWCSSIALRYMSTRTLIAAKSTNLPYPKKHWALSQQAAWTKPCGCTFRAWCHTYSCTRYDDTGWEDTVCGCSSTLANQTGYYAAITTKVLWLPEQMSNQCNNWNPNLHLPGQHMTLQEPHPYCWLTLASHSWRNDWKRIPWHGNTGAQKKQLA